ncbi:hypothetical protein [Mesorhizobium sp.]|uniref:hypothetical protein n=1 Tax=Mesorhizobium sp. TaxID=1871066 RepID=UPI000FD588AD|nr:hypothetical protein [Mesorhizobium sp.]RVC64384.1 hypothetical protein EN779_02005 [Mesorhizobium sp. M4B.F.Ca.ET.088.02.2.1]RWF27663.1 MAG: hypothetical protein EOS45_25140 [Mesorhizobium sp.]
MMILLRSSGEFFFVSIGTANSILAALARKAEHLQRFMVVFVLEIREIYLNQRPLRLIAVDGVAMHRVRSGGALN